MIMVLQHELSVHQRMQASGAARIFSCKARPSRTNTLVRQALSEVVYVYLYVVRLPLCSRYVYYIGCNLDSSIT